MTEKSTIKGEYQFINLSPLLKEKKIKEILPRIRKVLRAESGAELLKKEGIITDYKKKTNIIPNTGLNVLARLLAGDTTYSGEINYGAFGSGDTAFTLSSTQLNTEVYRKVISSLEHDGNIVWADWFIEAGDVANQNFEEFGAFIDGSAGANTGRAWSLVLTGGWVKTGSLFVSAKYTLSNA